MTSALDQSCPNPVSRATFGTFCGPRVVSRKSSREILQRTKLIVWFVCNEPNHQKSRQNTEKTFFRSSPKTLAKISLTYSKGLFLVFIYTSPVFASNLTRKRFLVLAGTDCTARSKSLGIFSQPLLFLCDKSLQKKFFDFEST